MLIADVAESLGILEEISHVDTVVQKEVDGLLEQIVLLLCQKDLICQ